MGKEYTLLQKKVQNLRSQLTPIFSVPPNREPGPAEQTFYDGINRQFLFIRNLIFAEMTSSSLALNRPLRRHLGRITREVHLLQATFQAQAQARHVEAISLTNINDDDNDGDGDDYGDQDLDHDGDNRDLQPENIGDKSFMVGFKVYENPEFCDDDDDWVKVEAYEGVKVDDGDWFTVDGLLP